MTNSPVALYSDGCSLFHILHDIQAWRRNEGSPRSSLPLSNYSTSPIPSFESLIRFTTYYLSLSFALILKDFSSWLMVTFSNSTTIMILSNFNIHLVQIQIPGPHFIDLSSPPEFCLWPSISHSLWNHTLDLDIVCTSNSVSSIPLVPPLPLLLLFSWVIYPVEDPTF